VPIACEAASLIRSAEDVGVVANALRELAQSGRRVLVEQRRAWDAFRDLVAAEERAFLGGPFDTMEWSHMAERLRHAQQDRGGLRHFTELVRYLVAAEKEHVRFVFNAFVEQGKTIERLADAY
jgi:hypothetical protein